ncbi:MAG: chemoreceptor glutamine deamidase CheD [Xanthobacteraceae bacterium]|jgi:chemotaxis protein CheD
MSAAARVLETAPAVLSDHAMPQRRPFYDAANSCWLIKVMPGEYSIAGRRNEVLVTVLGSCVSACIRDRDTGIGGMNHFMLPQSATGNWSGDQQSARFGNYAMEKLINELMKAGCRREALEAKVFGGANVIQSSQLVGTANAEFVLHYLEQEGIACAAQDLGGTQPRRIHYSPEDGKVVRRLLSNADSSAVQRLENTYATRIAAPARGGDIELFA